MEMGDQPVEVFSEWTRDPRNSRRYFVKVPFGEQLMRLDHVVDTGSPVLVQLEAPAPVRCIVESYRHDSADWTFNVSLHLI